MQHYDVPEWHPWLIVAACGATLILCGIVLQIVQLVVSIRQREKLRDEAGDPWDGRSLEWATASPPPAFNFAALPRYPARTPFGVQKRAAEQAGPRKSQSIRRSRSRATRRLALSARFSPPSWVLL